MSSLTHPTPLRDTMPLPVIALFILWAVQLRYPPLAYPATGLLVMLTLGGGVMLACLRLMPRLKGDRSIRDLLPALLLLAWIILRWAVQDFSAWGAEITGTWLWTGAWLVAGWLAAQRDSISEANPPKHFAPWGAVWLLALAGASCGFHGIYQYLVGYDTAHRELLSAIGGRPPSLTEMGILYHLELKRVASFLGDPNSLATLAALGLCGWLEIVTVRKHAALRLAALAGIAGCLAGVWLSGSRGGVLDVIIVLILYAGLFLLNTTSSPCSKVTSGATLFILVAFLTGPGQPPPLLAQNTVTQKQGWTTRSNTIQERLYYLDAGVKMIRMAPIAGLGPGGVERYFGRLKQPEARETKFLHNWILQTWAEFGLVGLGLLVWWLGSMATTLCRVRFWLIPGLRALGVMIVVVVIDGLIQVTWNQRELMSGLGLISGIVLGTSGNASSPRRAARAKFGWGWVLIVPPLAFLTAETFYLSGKNYKQMAVDAMSAGDDITASRLWKKAGKWVPRDPDVPAALARIQLTQGDVVGASKLLDKALQLAPESASLNAQAGQVAAQGGQLDKAKYYLTSALKLYPSKPEYNYQMAQLLVESGEPQTALKYARNAQKFNYMKEDSVQYATLVQFLEGQTSSTQP